MYDYIKGKVTRITPEYLVIEQQGIGWQIFAPNPYSFGSDELQVFLHHHVREDAQLLFGFPTLEQRELFRKLISVSGIGPKGALAILASGQPQHVIEAIEREDESYLVKFPGVGKKTARQMILDLKGKLTEFFGDPFDPEETNTLLSNDRENWKKRCWHWGHWAIRNAKSPKSNRSCGIWIWIQKAS